MKSFEQTCTRIAEALALLVAEESVALQAGQYDRAIETQRRAGPLVSFLAAHAPAAAGVRDVIAALRERRRASSERLDTDMARIRHELCACEFSRRQLARIGPVYAARPGNQSRLSATG